MKHHQKPPKHEQQQTRIRELSNENKELRKEVKKLHKQLQQIKTGWCPKCLEKETPDQPLPKIKNQDKPKDWQCHKCDSGVLKMIQYTRMDETWYFRQCNNCNNRSRGKRWSESVKD